MRGGQVVPFPDCDFTMEAHIEGSSEVYKAERKGGVCKHCKQDGDRLIIFFDNHNLVEGRLLMELTIEYPDPDYSEDGIRQEHFVEIAPIQIVADNGDALDLEIFIGPTSNVSLVSLFQHSTLITINAEATDFTVESARNFEESIDVSNNLNMFQDCTARKVSVNSKSVMNDNKGWYLLPSVRDSNVECFDFSGGGETGNIRFSISNIIENLLPDVTSRDHKPNIIFRDYTGEATEELKQKVLDKGYTSVEFYKGDTKVL